MKTWRETITKLTQTFKEPFNQKQVQKANQKQQIQNKEVLGFSIEGNFEVEKEMYMNAHEEFASILAEIEQLLKEN